MTRIRGAQGYRDALPHHQQNLSSLFRLRRDRQSLGDPLPHGMGHPGGGHTPVLSHGHVLADPGAGGPTRRCQKHDNKETGKGGGGGQGTLVYCGPTIPGVAKQFTFYRGGVNRGAESGPRAQAGAARPNHTAGSAAGGHAAAGKETWPHLRPVPRGAEAEITGGKAKWQHISTACITRNRPQA